MVGGMVISSQRLGVSAKNTSEITSIMSRSGDSTWLGESAKQALSLIAAGGLISTLEWCSGVHRGHLTLDVCRQHIGVVLRLLN